ncbi:MAG TPA: hypothetical protein VGY56_02455 [Verrucomicrobiae bacterium]|nr:hypothetical protein [Verrucomicrobiae bacterium]
MPDDFEPSDAELEMVVDEALQKTGQPPVNRSPEKGIADMQGRLKLLNEQKAKLLKGMGTLPFDTQRGEELTKIDREIREARQRLGEYQTQLKGRN